MFLESPHWYTDPFGCMAMYITPQYRLAIWRRQTLQPDTSLLGRAGMSTAHCHQAQRHTHTEQVGGQWHQDSWNRVPTLTTVSQNFTQFCKCSWRRRLPVPPQKEKKQKNTLIQIKPMWIYLLTFRFVINTYRCLYVNRLLGTITCKHNTGHPDFGSWYKKTLYM